MYHEFTHQVLYMYTGRNDSPVWLSESIAVYTESPFWEHGDMLLGRMAGSELFWAWTQDIAADKALSLANLMRLDHEAWSKAKDPYPNYKAAAGLSFFCMEADDRRYRADFVDFIRDSYRGETRGYALSDYLGMSREAFISAFNTWAKQQTGLQYERPSDPFSGPVKK